jgi:Ser/Thr protein kinase RdoA (MazF antagonist)
MHISEPAPDSFESLDPDTILNAVEHHTGLFLDGSLTPFNSYINRVYGVTDEEGNRYVVKFYRNYRWSDEALADEHIFLNDCTNFEIPVPITLGESPVGRSGGFRFSVFPRISGRTFDIESDEDWIRSGALIGRVHAAGRLKKAPHRTLCDPEHTTGQYINRLIAEKIVHPDCLSEFSAVCTESLERAKRAYRACAGSGADWGRIHGDCHRGNILRKSDGTLTILDFDDMMTGPAIQDLWLLLPGHLEDSRRELNLMLEGYEDFCSFDRPSAELVESLRFMRQIYFLNWCALQRNDPLFAERNPGWGEKAFWIRETGDLETQLDFLA